jgi:hypothetical protein
MAHLCLSTGWPWGLGMLIGYLCCKALLQASNSVEVCGKLGREHSQMVPLCITRWSRTHDRHAPPKPVAWNPLTDTRLPGTPGAGDAWQDT